MAALFCRNLDQRAGSGFCSLYRIGDLLRPRAHQAPLVPIEDYDRQFTALQILPVRNARIGRQQHVELLFLSRMKEVAVEKRAPTLLPCSLAVLTVCPSKILRSATGVPWSKRMRIIRRDAALRGSALQNPERLAHARESSRHTAR